MISLARAGPVASTAASRAGATVDTVTTVVCRQASDSNKLSRARVEPTICVMVQPSPDGQVVAVLRQCQALKLSESMTLMSGR